MKNLFIDFINGDATCDSIKKFFVQEDGVTAIEYGLIAALIAVVIITAVSSVGTNLSGVFNFIASKLVAPES